MNELIIRARKTYKVYCPMCGEYFSGSKYLRGVFRNNDKLLWLANMVTHYRHEHITSWNKCWGDGGKYYRSKWFSDYETEKEIVNERAKRQIIRKCKEYMSFYSFSANDIKTLKGTEEETINLAIKIFK